MLFFFTCIYVTHFAKTCLYALRSGRYARVATLGSLRSGRYARVATLGSLRSGRYARVATLGSLRSGRYARVATKLGSLQNSGRYKTRVTTKLGVFESLNAVDSWSCCELLLGERSERHTGLFKRDFT